MKTITEHGTYKWGYYLVRFTDKNFGPRGILGIVHLCDDVWKHHGKKKGDSTEELLKIAKVIEYLNLNHMHKDIIRDRKARVLEAASKA